VGLSSSTSSSMPGAAAQGSCASTGPPRASFNLMRCCSVCCCFWRLADWLAVRGAVPGWPSVTVLLAAGLEDTMSAVRDACGAVVSA
jgi:hypothetical protein